MLLPGFSPFPDPPVLSKSVKFCIKNEAFCIILGAVTETKVLGCGVISWKPPLGNEGLKLGYAVRFFDGATYQTSTYRTIERFFENIGRQWAKENVPQNRTVYADVSLFLF